MRRRPLVLCYHAVSDSWQHSLSVPRAMLERQVRGLLRFYRPASAEEVLAGRERGLHVTFDEAFRSIGNAIPTLRRLGVPSTVFACSGYAPTGAPLAVSELTNELDSHPEELATMPWHDLAALIEGGGVEVGSHTVTHPHLTRLGDAELRRELVDSRARIEDELGVRCRYLAYPFGEEDMRVREAARAAGYLAAFALRAHGNPLDRYAVPRLGIWRRDRVLRSAAKVALRRDQRRVTMWSGPPRQTEPLV